MNERIIHLDQICWEFDNEMPYLETKPRRGYRRNIKVHPFPCYSHDLSLVQAGVWLAESAFPVEFTPQWYVLGYDTLGGTNGYANRDYDYDSSGEPKQWEPSIVLSGKRIPIHPAMTRYLVAHEYGHVVQWWIEHKRGIKDEITTDFDREYMEMRGCGLLSNEYGGGKWHSNVGEVIANDFRICVARVESEFWPHPVSHPLETPCVVEFWKEMTEKYALKEPIAA